VLCENAHKNSHRNSTPKLNNKNKANHTYTILHNCNMTIHSLISAVWVRSLTAPENGHIRNTKLSHDFPHFTDIPFNSTVRVHALTRLKEYTQKNKNELKIKLNLFLITNS